MQNFTKHVGLMQAMFDAAIKAALPSATLCAFMPVPPKGRTIVVGAGKASAAMAQVFEQNYPAPLEGLIVTRYGHAVPCKRIEIVEAAHPVPDDAGTKAAARMLQMVQGLTADDMVVALISGGGSALLSLPVQGVSVEEKRAINRAAFAIHSQVHAARPDVVAAAHAHSMYGKSWSTLGRLLDPITQDACAFYEDHGLFDDFTGVVFDPEEGARLAKSLGQYKAVILRNHGLLTVGQNVDEAIWWFITMDRCCQSQLLAEAAGTPVIIDPEHARVTRQQVGSQKAGWFQFQPMWDMITKEQPDLFE